MDSILQDSKECYVTHSINNLHKHHIYSGNGYRKISDQNGFWVWLRQDWHNGSDYGVHFNKQLDLKLKRICQAKYEETHTRDEFMQLIGRNYL